MKAAGWLAGGAWALAFLGLFLARPVVVGDRDVALDLQGIEVLQVMSSTLVTIEVDSRRPAKASFTDDRGAVLLTQRRGKVLRVEADMPGRILSLVVPASVRAYVLSSDTRIGGKETVPAARVMALRDIEWEVPAKVLRIERIPRAQACGSCGCSFEATVDASVSSLDIDVRGGHASLKGSDRIGHARVRLGGGKLSVTGAARLDQIELLPAAPDTVAKARPNTCESAAAAATASFE